MNSIALRERILGVDLNDDSSFKDILNQAMNLLGLSEIDLAVDLSVSQTTIMRWKLGSSIPFPLMRKPVYRVLMRRLP